MHSVEVLSGWQESYEICQTRGAEINRNPSMYSVVASDYAEKEWEEQLKIMCRNSRRAHLRTLTAAEYDRLVPANARLISEKKFKNSRYLKCKCWLEDLLRTFGCVLSYNMFVPGY